MGRYLALLDLFLDDFCPFQARDETLPDQAVGQVIGPERVDHYRMAFLLHGNGRIGHLTSGVRIPLEIYGSSGQKQLPHPARIR
jgi:hypothetical protein